MPRNSTTGFAGILIPMFLPMFLTACLFCTCTEPQNEHYDRGDSLPGENLLERIAAADNLSDFKRLIELAEYDSLLRSGQTFTVFAPVNGSFASINWNTITGEEARRIAGNHIARFNISTAIPPDKPVRMINRKIHAFADGGASFGNARLLEKDIRAKNGILHLLETPAPYRYNLYEFIQQTPATSRLAAFIRSFEENRFDEEMSIPLDVNEFGQTVYDTVTTFYNRLFDDVLYGGLGAIHLEDSVFTLLAPSDQAWNAAYEKMKPYFKRYSASPEVADSIQNLQVSLAILENLVFRGKQTAAASLDSILSTSPRGAYMHNPGELFAEAQTVEGSNGWIYLTDNLKYNDAETWNKPIIVESDIQEGRTVGPGTAVYTRTAGMETEIPVTESRYITVEATSTSVQPEVTFEIPDVLSGAYNIYVEFLPGSIDAAPNDSTKVLFALNYMNAAGRMVTKDVISNTLVTSGTKKVVMEVASNFEFPVSGCYDRLWMMDCYKGLHTLQERVYSTALKIKTNVSTTEFNRNTFTRKFRIDRVIFEPVNK
ncbi:MAG: fasciclin domain-containing protein [Tannerella sp.]|jgi:hypothetical protein|nr:fasciclin domain-containing protein [Tannerella sp.]